MFNNPFDSFHNTVAEAKDEREQLDRLLTVSTPRERLLVAAIAALLVILAAWLFFGSVHRSLALDGLLVEPTETSEGKSVQAFVWVRPEVAPDIAAGMPALIELAVEDGEAGTLGGKIVAITAVPLSEIPAFGSSAPVTVHRVEIALDDRLDFGSLTARECRVAIELGRQSPLALFGLRQS
ncbi:MAG: hypothetical protein OXH68_00270 [Gammaproteobacteria bacterium]|nr:hypothetical protein [Gammaproteobacteria bacterium]